MRSDKAVRRTIVRRSHKLFFHYYFGHYIEFPIAPLHEALFNLSQNDTHSMMVISAFRNSGKSTLLTLSHPIWSIINGRTKYILIISENQQKAQTLLKHIKDELTDNEMLKRDLGPFKEERVGWNSVSLTINNYGAKITAASTEQSVRGLRHRNHRPDLIIMDDCESQDSVRTQESRDRLSQWLGGDVIPAGHIHTKLVVIGSILHPDSLIPRLQRSIDDGSIDGIYRMYPIVDESGRSLWPGKFPDTATIGKEKARGVSEREWQIEYMLRPIVSEDQIIMAEHICYYDIKIDSSYDTYTGVDLAISQSSTADFTAMVSGVVDREEDWKLYILPHPVHEQLKGPEILERIVAESLRLGNGVPTPVFIENVAFQQAMIDFVKQRGIPAEGVSPGGNDKRARLISISELIKSGRILFPRKGAEKLINQILFFGYEKHDDLMDALIFLVMKVSEWENSKIIIPRSYGKPINVLTREKLEREADLHAIQTSEHNRGYWSHVNTGALHESQQRARDVTNEESLYVFRKMSRGY